MKEETMWILVEIKSGIPVSVKAFSTEELAKIEEVKLRRSLNFEKDETGVFEVSLPMSAEKESTFNRNYFTLQG